MEFLKRLMNVEKWTYRELLFLVVLFFAFNLIAPRGFVQWILLQQDLRRMRGEIEQSDKHIADIQEDIQSFKRSSLKKEQKIRDLGYLRDNEISLEFVDPNRKNALRESSSSAQAAMAR